MLGSFLTRGLVLAFGYAYPAYECYKTVERNKPEIEHLLFWCQYWILVATLTVCERVGDAFISWVPMYSEAKLAFFIYLWYPKTKGTSYVYDSFLRPYIAKHESDIDRNLLELRTRAGDMAVLYWQRAASYGQTRTLEILQFIASQSTPRPRPVQQGPVTAALNHQPSKKVQIEEENKEPPSPTSSVSSSGQDLREVAAEVSEPSNAPTAASLSPAPSQAAAPKPSTSAEASSSIQSKTADEAEAEAEAVHSEAATSGSNAEPPKETGMEGALRRTCGKLRKARSVTARKEAESIGS